METIGKIIYQIDAVELEEILQKVIIKTKIVWPTIEEIKTRLVNSSILVLSKELGVSGNAIRKHIRKFSI